MKKEDTDKINQLQDDDMSLWLKVRKETWDEVSDMHPLVCACGRLCTGLHENHCKKFQDKINLKTLRKLERGSPA